MGEQNLVLRIYDCIYEIYRKILSHEDNKYDNAIKVLYDYLTDEMEEDLEEEITKNVKNDVIKRDNFKNLCILNLVSNFYELTNKDINLKICDEDKKDAYEMINDKDYSCAEIIKIFKSKDYKEFGYYVIDAFFDYMKSYDINKKSNILLLIREGKLPKMIKMNPMVIINYSDVLKNKYLINSYISQEIIKIYDKLCEYYEHYDLDEDMINVLRDKIDTMYGEEAKSIYGLIASNAYEGILCYDEFEGIKMTQDQKEFVKLMNDERLNLDNLYDFLKSNDAFFAFVFQNFIDKNYYLVEDDIWMLKENEEKQDYGKIIKKYNNYRDRKI